MSAQPFARSDKTLTADKFGSDCPTLSAKRASQSDTSDLGKGALSALSPSGHLQSEDCLTLNIWTKPQTGEPKKAVLVWIYGGGFQSGATNNPTYNGQTFAEKQDVVLVSLKLVTILLSKEALELTRYLVTASTYSGSHLPLASLTLTLVSWINAKDLSGFAITSEGSVVIQSASLYSVNLQVRGQSIRTPMPGLMQKIRL
jgi:hypothetical protein